MESKVKSILILTMTLLVCNMFQAQKHIIGKVIDNNTEKPIFGVIVSNSEKELTYTDEHGKFVLNKNETSSWTDEDHVFFSHVAYKTRDISFKSLIPKSGNRIALRLEPNILMLGEVQISANLINETKRILKSAYEAYEKYEQTDYYTTSANYKQVIDENNLPVGYLEYKGEIVFPKENNQAFVIPEIFPSSIRRTSENPTIVKSWYSHGGSDKGSYNQLGGLFARTSWVNYRFFEINHPLKKHKKFEFELRGSEVVSDKDCYVIYYVQKKNIKEKGWSIYELQGNLYIDKKDFKLIKSTCSYRLENLSYNKYVIRYELLKKKMYPLQIDVINYRYGNNNIDISNIVIKGRLTLNNQDLGRKITIMNDPLSLWFEQTTQYNINSWKDNFNDKEYTQDLHEIINSKNGGMDAVFMKGAATYELDTLSLMFKRFGSSEK